MAKRIPKIYLGAPINNNMTLQWKSLVFGSTYDHVVEFLDPARHKLDSIKDRMRIEKVNMDDIDSSDAACFYFPSDITAGTALDLNICVIRKLPVFVFTFIIKDFITPYVLNLINGKTYVPPETPGIVNNWLKGWYERTNSRISG